VNIAVEIGGTKLQIATGDPVIGTLDKVYRFDVDKGKGAGGILHTIESQINSLSNSPASISIGFGGPINNQSGIIMDSHQIEGWSGLNLRQWFKDRYDANLYIENDANAAALGEASYGAGKNYDKVFYITLGSGVGGGCVISKNIYHGNSPGEAEIGLMRLNKQGDTIESLCSGWALNNIIKEEIQNNEASILRTLVGNINSHQAKYLGEALNQKDQLAIEIFNKYCDNLAFGISHVCHLFNPEIVVIGGGVSLMGERLITIIEQKLTQYLSASYKPGPELKLSELGEQVVLVGALSLRYQY